ncbi:hypothetical protein RDWZM_006271 [Blomia tropicalis]|uniref:Uncharacterized protein n=1 Tax=Blomia tropicalis TaxID=40697 RepID=A0A9Q0M7U3_BLOTA|nr:hypothetical protein RDWZM_006271 [Blomia tropicalis]
MAKITFKAMLKLEIKSDKFENRLLVFTTYRLFLFHAKGSAKLENSFNYLDISSIESRQPNRLVLGVLGDTRHYAFQSCDPNQEEINQIILHLTTTLKSIFPHTPLESFIRRMEVEPHSRLEPVIEYIQSVEEKARFRLLDIPCGGFSNQYSCFCDQFSIPFREEVAWDIDTIYSAHNNTELSILDFEHLDLKDMVPIIAALAYNGWFTKFRVSNVKIIYSGQSGSDQICDQIINLVRRSVTLEEIFLDNTGIRADFVNKIFSAMLLNNQTAIRVIDLSNNPIEDKGLKNMTAFVAKSFHMANSININTSTDDLSSSLSLNFSTNSNYQQSMSMTSMANGSGTAPMSTNSAKLMYKGLVHLNLSHCGLTSKGISELSESLYLNKSMFTTLTYLNLSDNSFKDDLTKLYNFLAQPNNLTNLDLSGTDCNLESTFGALLHGCTNNLVHLNLSRNQFSSKKSSHKDLIVPAAIKKFFSTAIFLRTLNLSNNRLPPEALKAVLLGLACNESATDIRINLSSNEFKSNGAAVLELALTDIRCVSGLDLSDNSLDMELIGVVNAISKNKSIKFLSIGRNFGNIKAKHMPKVLDAFVQLLQEVDCSLESLSLVDSKLRADTSIILNALSSNHSLVNIDVSGNMMGLAGAKTLAKALQVNNRLETIYLDRNFITTAGFIDIAYALERNYTLKYLPVPVQDVQAAMIKMADRTEAAITKIQEYIRRNNLPQSAVMRNHRLSSLAQSNFIIDSNLFNQIERTSIQLQQILQTKSFDPSNRIPSVDSIDINLNSEQDNTIIADDCLDDLSRAEGLLREAYNVRHMCNRIQELYSNSSTMNGVQSSCSFQDNFGRRFSSVTIAKPIEANIIEFAKELKRTFESQIASISELMIQCIKEEFPQLFIQCSRLEIDLKELYQSLIYGTNSYIPSMDYFHMCLTENACTTWTIKLEQILHTVASQICNKVLVEINRCLAFAHRSLTGGNGSDSKSIDYNNGHLQRNYQGQYQSHHHHQNHHLQSNGNVTTTRSLTPDVLRTRAWIDSSSSHESTDLNLSNDGQMLDVDSNNAIATPKIQNQKRQNVYIRKLRPQSVLDGAVTNDDFPDLLLKSGNSNGSYLADESSPLGECRTMDSVKPVQHLTKMRPRFRKTRAPTRVTLVDSKSTLVDTNANVDVSAKLDEGLDNFFPNSLDSKECSLPTIKESLNGHTHLTSSNNKPQPQPRKLLRKFGFTKQNSEQIYDNKTSNDSSITSGHIQLKTEDFIRSSSPTFFPPNLNTPKRSEHVSICSTEPEVRGGGSPLPSGPGSNDFLAEIRAKQEKRTHGSTPLNEHLTFAGTLELNQKRTSPNNEQQFVDKPLPPEPNNNGTSSNNNSVSVAKRATIFGELHKSPSKGSINQIAAFSSLIEESSQMHGSITSSNQPMSATITTSQQPASMGTPSIKQRPKSMVGMLGAKFELSLMNSSGNK